MGCASSTAVFSESVASAAAVDLTLAPHLTDAEAVAQSHNVQQHRPLVLRMPRWAQPDAPLSGDGFAQLCMAGATLRCVEFNEAALPHVSAEAVAQAFGFLGALQEVSLRGPSLPQRVLSLLGEAGSMPLTNVRTVLLGGEGVNTAAFASLPNAFPCLECLYLQHPLGVSDWRTLSAGLLRRGVVLSHATRVVFDIPEWIDEVTEKTLHPLWPNVHPGGFVQTAPRPPMSRSPSSTPRNASLTPRGSTHALRSPRSIELVCPAPPPPPCSCQGARLGSSDGAQPLTDITRPRSRRTALSAAANGRCSSSMEREDPSHSSTPGGTHASSLHAADRSANPLEQAPVTDAALHTAQESVRLGVSSCCIMDGSLSASNNFGGRSLTQDSRSRSPLIDVQGPGRPVSAEKRSMTSRPGARPSPQQRMVESLRSANCSATAAPLPAVPGVKPVHQQQHQQHTSPDITFHLPPNIA